jgi:uncharacterized Zn finger protein
MGQVKTRRAENSWFHRNDLRRAAGPRSFERGEAYFKAGRVKSLDEYEGTITAQVAGTRPYRVKLRPRGRGLESECTCPFGQEGAFCKHVVAVGLAWLARGKTGRAGKAAAQQPGKAGLTLKDVRAWLLDQDKESLADLLMAQAMDDDGLRRRLLLQAAKGAGTRTALDTYRRAIDQAVDAASEDDFDGGYEYASGIGEALDPIEQLFKEGHASEAMELADYALDAVEKVMGSVDDSYGEMGALVDRLEEIHLKACRQAKPDPITLARRLFDWELRGNWGAFSNPVKAYASILGKTGLAEYRKQAEAEWAKMPALEPGGRDAGRYGERYRITRIMEALARTSGKVEDLVAIKTRDLSSPSAYLEIAETYRQKGRHDLARDWAERGIKAFPQRVDWSLGEFLANAYHRDKRHDDALALIWKLFTEYRSLEGYKSLKTHAGKAGRWKEWKPKALAYLREHAAKEKAKAGGGRWAGYPRTDHSNLVRILLWERDVEAAWKEAKEGGCTGDLWMQLAEKREKDHPADAVEVYRKRIAPTLGRTNNEAYREVVGLLRKMRGLMVRIGKKAEFGRLLAEVRAGNKQKRNFVKMLDGARWG